ncbi:MAG: DUF1361 domain-containing protein [Verrucomicrobiota bacterium]
MNSLTPFLNGVRCRFPWTQVIPTLMRPCRFANVREWYWLVPLGLLTCASAVGGLLFAARLVVTRQVEFLYLPWNLFLAWVPVVFSGAAWWRWRRAGSESLSFFICSFAWLIFFPNAPYVLTDLVHLQARPPAPLWFDATLLIWFGWTGYLLGYFSLYVMHVIVSNIVGPWKAWAFVLVVLGLTGLGLYIGRFLRWNSWDLFFAPWMVLSDVGERLVHFRQNKDMIVFSGLCSGFLLLSYLFLYSVCQLHFHRRGAENGQ